MIVRANASGGNNQMNRFLSGGGGGGFGGGGRLSLEIRGEDLDESQRVAQATKDLLDTVPGIADARLGRDDGRPELAVRVDRAKAALVRRQRHDGRQHDSDQCRRHAGGDRSARGGKEYPIIVRLREDERQFTTDVEDVLVSTPQGQVLPAKNLMRWRTPSDRCRSSGRTSSASRSSAPNPRSR